MTNDTWKGVFAELFGGKPAAPRNRRASPAISPWAQPPAKVAPQKPAKRREFASDAFRLGVWAFVASTVVLALLVASQDNGEWKFAPSDLRGLRADLEAWQPALFDALAGSVIICNLCMLVSGNASWLLWQVLWLGGNLFAAGIASNVLVNSVKGIYDMRGQEHPGVLSFGLLMIVGGVLLAANMLFFREVTTEPKSPSGSADALPPQHDITD